MEYKSAGPMVGAEASANTDSNTGADERIGLKLGADAQQQRTILCLIHQMFFLCPAKYVRIAAASACFVGPI